MPGLIRIPRRSRRRSNKDLIVKNDEDEKPRVGKYDQAYHESFKRNTGVETPIGPPPGNTNAMRHGIYANRFLAEDEKKVFDSIIDARNWDAIGQWGEQIAPQLAKG